MIKKLTALLLTTVITIAVAAPIFGANAPLPHSTPASDAGIIGGTMFIGVPGSGEMRFNPLFFQSAADAFITELILPPLLILDENMLITNYGPASFAIDVENATVTITLTEEIFWHDGFLLTLDDLLFAYEVIGRPDYTWTGGHRFNTVFAGIIGMYEYRAGEADYISGIYLSEDKMTMIISYEYIDPTMRFGNNIWSTPLSRRSFDGVPIYDMDWAVQSSELMVGYGPFMIDYIHAWETVTLVRNDNFWLGAPYVERLEVHVLGWGGAGEDGLMFVEDGIIDVFIGNVAAVMADNPNPTNFSYIAHPTSNLGFTAFQMGGFDPATDERVFDETRVVSDVNLRRAMGYALNEQRIIDALGRQYIDFPATSAAPLANAYRYDGMLGFSVFDAELANSILDAAGYTQRDSEGYRMSPNGEVISLTWAVHWNAINEIAAPMAIEDWANIGIRVELWLDHLVEFSMLTDFILHNDPWWDYDTDDIDLYDLAFALTFNPSTIWAADAPFNATGYASYEHDAILNRLLSPAAMDLSYAADAARAWQLYFYENAIAIPRRYTFHVTAVNNRVANFSRQHGNIREVSALAAHLWQLTAEFPYASDRPARNMRQTQNLWQSLRNTQGQLYMLGNDLDGMRDIWLAEMLSWDAPYYVGDSGITVIDAHGQEMVFERWYPIIVNDRLLVPVYVLANDFYIETDGHSSVMFFGRYSSDVFIEFFGDFLWGHTDTGEWWELQTDTPVIMLNSMPMIPLRAFAESLGMRVEWDGATRSAYLNSYPFSLF